jgi:hypothetical protein
LGRAGVRGALSGIKNIEVSLECIFFPAELFERFSTDIAGLIPI